MHLSVRQALWFLVSLLLVGASISSCSAFGAGTTTTASSADSMTLNVAQTSNGLGFFPLHVAIEEHFIKAQGLTLTPATPTLMGTGAKISAAMEGGSIDIAAGIITDPFNIARVDSSIKILGSLMTSFTADIIASKSFEQQTNLTEKSSLEAKVKSLVGKKLGITAPGTASEAFFIYLFRMYGLDAKKDAQLVNLGNASAATGLAALKNGLVDVIAFPVPTGQVAELQGTGDLFISPVRGDVPSMKGIVTSVFYAKQSIIDAKPKAVQALIRALAQAEDFIHKNPDKALASLQQYLNLTPKTAKSVMTEWMSSIAQTPQISQSGYDAAAQFHVKGGLISIAPLYNTLVASSTITDALNGSSSSS